MFKKVDEALILAAHVDREPSAWPTKGDLQVFFSATCIDVNAVQNANEREINCLHGHQRRG